jgi:hypothetical protein
MSDVGSFISRESNSKVPDILRRCWLMSSIHRTFYDTESCILEVNLEVPCRKILQHVKDPLRYFRYWQEKFSLLHPFLLLVPDVSAGRTARELWWMSQELSPAIIITMALHAYVSHGRRTIGPLVVAILRHSLTPS